MSKGKIHFVEKITYTYAVCGVEGKTLYRTTNKKKVTCLSCKRTGVYNAYSKLKGGKAL